MEIDHETFCMVILSLPLIQEGQLSVSGKRMCTILVNRLEDQACPVNVWLGKLTMLDMTPLGWQGHKTSTQTKSLKPVGGDIPNLIAYIMELPKSCSGFNLIFKVSMSARVSSYFRYVSSTCRQILTTLHEYLQGLV